jgi:putative tricarboxylic transport membrane protein
MGLGVALQPYNVMIAVVSLILGIIVGVLPGLGGANGCAILIPITFAMNPTAGVIMLACIYWGALYGGGICSILFNIPGEPWAVAVTFDGYPMAKSGRAGKALVLSFLSHGFGAVVGVILLTFFAPIIAEFALRFGCCYGAHLQRHDAIGRKIRFEVTGGHLSWLYSGSCWNGHREWKTPNDVWHDTSDGRF